MSAIDLSSDIETKPEIEERVGIRLAGLSAFFTDEEYSGPQVEVRGDISGRASQDFKVVVAVLDANRRVIGTDDKWYFESKFVGFDTFTITADTRSVPASVRVTVAHL